MRRVDSTTLFLKIYLSAIPATFRGQTRGSAPTLSFAPTLRKFYIYMASYGVPAKSPIQTTTIQYNHAGTNLHCILLQARTPALQIRLFAKSSGIVSGFLV